MPHIGHWRGGEHLTSTSAQALTDPCDGALLFAGTPILLLTVITIKAGNIATRAKRARRIDSLMCDSVYGKTDDD